MNIGPIACSEKEGGNTNRDHPKKKIIGTHCYTWLIDLFNFYNNMYNASNMDL